MNEEYQKGQEIGELRSDIKNLSSLMVANNEALQQHIENQDKLNDKTDQRLVIIEAWIQSTTGKIVVVTAVASAVGWFVYQIIAWIINYKFSK